MPNNDFRGTIWQVNWLVTQKMTNKTFSLKYTYIQIFFFLNIVLLPFFDNISGVLFKLGIMGDGSIGSPSQLGRLLATVFLIYLIFKYCKNTSKILSIIIFSYFLLVEFSVAVIHRELVPFLYGVVMSSKVIFFFLFIILVKDLAEIKKVDMGVIESWLITYGTLISFLVLISYLSGFHISNYSKGIATRGLFVSGNGLGVVMGSCLLILIHNLKSFNLIKILHISLLFVTTTLIGTKGSMIFSLLALIYFLFRLGFKFPILSTIFVSTFLCYFLFPIVDLLLLVFENIIYKFNNIDNKWVLIASSRDKFILDAFEQVNWLGAYALRFIFGGGGFYAYMNFDSFFVNPRKLLENDIFELFFSYGFISSFSYFLVYAWGLLSLLNISATSILFYCLLYFFILLLLDMLYSMVRPQ
ncbi:hypothetical protein [Agarivorans gilvus]|uniref:hypothetical protein n=1 Tax=Agarivorans gilvus TaxID=680279 RepID=UPI0018DE980E|nr:hypothetical protein [Agarivorans gilvus]